MTYVPACLLDVFGGVDDWKPEVIMKTLTADIVCVCFFNHMLLRCLVGLLSWDLLVSLWLAVKALDGVAGLLHQGLLHVFYELHNYEARVLYAMLSKKQHMLLPPFERVSSLPPHQPLHHHCDFPAVPCHPAAVSAWLNELRESVLLFVTSKA